MAAGRFALLRRWHLYLGLCTAPFLLILSVTGALYLFNDELNDRIYPELRFAPSGEAVRAAGDLVAAVRDRHPGATVTRIDMPAAAGRSAEVFVTPAQGDPLRVFVDPGDGTVLGDYVYTRTLVGFADRMHGSLLLGKGGEAVVELAAIWALVLIATGLYLWWPRGRGGWRDGFLFFRQRRGRARWREVHRLTGVYAAVLIVFLILTGLPWAGFVGERVLTPVSNALGLGYPPQLRHHGGDGGKTLPDTLGEAPWTLQQAPLPMVPAAHDRHSHHGSGAMPDTSTAAINRVHRALAAAGLPLGYRLSLPAEAGDPYSAYTYPARPEGQRTLHLNSNGDVLVDTDFDDYGAIAKAVEYGVALHMGNYFGRANQIVMLLACLAVIALVITGLVLWRRRPPTAPAGVRPR